MTQVLHFFQQFGPIGLGLALDFRARHWSNYGFGQIGGIANGLISFCGDLQVAVM